MKLSKKYHQNHLLKTPTIIRISSTAIANINKYQTAFAFIDSNHCPRFIDRPCLLNTSAPPWTATAVLLTWSKLSFRSIAVSVKKERERVCVNADAWIKALLNWYFHVIHTSIDLFLYQLPCTYHPIWSFWHPSRLWIFVLIRLCLVASLKTENNVGNNMIFSINNNYVQMPQLQEYKALWRFWSQQQCMIGLDSLEAVFCFSVSRTELA